MVKLDPKFNFAGLFNDTAQVVSARDHNRSPMRQQNQGQPNINVRVNMASSAEQNHDEVKSMAKKLVET